MGDVSSDQVGGAALLTVEHPAERAVIERNRNHTTVVGAYVDENDGAVVFDAADSAGLDRKSVV